jgi:hypothetical protein
MNEPRIHFCHKLRLSCPNLLNEAILKQIKPTISSGSKKVLSNETKKTPSQQIRLKYLKYLIGLKVI